MDWQTIAIAYYFGSVVIWLIILGYTKEKNLLDAILGIIIIGWLFLPFSALIEIGEQLRKWKDKKNG